MVPAAVTAKTCAPGPPWFQSTTAGAIISPPIAMASLEIA